jgi:hypothetical protein
VDVRAIAACGFVSWDILSLLGAGASHQEIPDENF